MRNEQNSSASAIPNDAKEIVAAARISGAKTGDIITLDDGSRWRLLRRTLIPIQ